MVVLHVRDKDRDHLPHVHGGCEDQGPELLHLRVDEPLGADRRGGQRERVRQEAGLREPVPEGGNELPGRRQGGQGDDRGEAVHVQHLVALGRLVLLEELLLHRGRQAVQRQEGQQPAKAEEAAGPVRGCRRRACHDKLRDATCHSRGNEPILPIVALAADCDAPQHDRQHLEALANHLHSKGHVLQSLVLASAGVHIREGDNQVLPQRCRVPHLLVVEAHHAQ
mmetsp:Transcript_44873/g.143082  ORF Transcript_44873/g.143082 Transcript_44873/m.143082 type:complete len:224 (+) Transcript_44873:179-850(+)